MSPSRPRRLVGRCPFLFLLAVCSDVLGLTLVLVGIFAKIELNGRSFGEFIIYSGGILLFFSLLWWLAWYSFNLEVSIEDLIQDYPVSPKSNLVQLARKFSESFSKRSRRKAEFLTVGMPSIPNLPSDPSPLTTSVFINSGFSGHLDTSTSAGKAMELSAVSSMNGEAGGGQGVVDRLV